MRLRLKRSPADNTGQPQPAALRHRMGRQVAGSPPATVGPPAEPAPSPGTRQGHRTSAPCYWPHSTRRWSASSACGPQAGPAPFGRWPTPRHPSRPLQAAHLAVSCCPRSTTRQTNHHLRRPRIPRRSAAATEHTRQHVLQLLCRGRPRSDLPYRIKPPRPPARRLRRRRRRCGRSVRNCHLKRSARNSSTVF